MMNHIDRIMKLAEEKKIILEPGVRAKLELIQAEINSLYAQIEETAKLMGEHKYIVRKPDDTNQD